MREVISVDTVLSFDVAKYETDKVDISLAASANFLNCPAISTLPPPVSTFAETLASTDSLSFSFLA